MSLMAQFGPQWRRRRPKLPLLGEPAARTSVELPERLVYTVEQAAAEQGSPVRRGQLLGLESDVPVLAAADGRLTELRRIKRGRDGHPVTQLVIDTKAELTEEEQAADPLFPLEPLAVDAAPASLLERFERAGVVAVSRVPQALATRLRVNAELLVIGAVDAEPGLSAAAALAQGAPQRVVAAAKLLAHASGIHRVAIAGLAPTIDALRGAAEDADIELLEVPPLYPNGLDELVARAALDGDGFATAVPVESALAALDAVEKGEPHVLRTITARAADGNTRRELTAPAGCSFADLLGAAGFELRAHDRLLAGGEMMGAALIDTDATLDAWVRGVTVLADERAAGFACEPCIDCGDCATLCPMRLQPQWIGRLAEYGHYQRAAEEFDAERCVRCGLCAYTCPAGRPLVQWIELVCRETANTPSAEGGAA